MAETSIDTSALDALADRMEGLAVTQLDAVDRAGLRAVGAVVAPALASVTPIAFQIPSLGSNALRPHELRDSVRAHIADGQGGRGPAVVVDFGRANYVAHWIDAGHHVVVGGYSRLQPDGSRRGTGQVVSYVPANPFVRSTQDSPALQSAAQEAYFKAAQLKVDEVMRGQ